MVVAFVLIAGAGVAATAAAAAVAGVLWCCLCVRGKNKELVSC